MTPEPSPDSVVIDTTLSCTAEAIWASEERSTTRVTDELPVLIAGELPLLSKASAAAAPTPPAASASTTAAAPVARILRPRPGRVAVRVSVPTGCTQDGWPSAPGCPGAPACCCDQAEYADCCAY